MFLQSSAYARPPATNTPPRAMLSTTSGSYPSSATVCASSRTARPKPSYVRFSRTSSVIGPSHLRPVEIHEGARRGGTALPLITRPVPLGAVRELRRRTQPEHAQLAD